MYLEAMCRDDDMIVVHVDQTGMVQVHCLYVSMCAHAYVCMCLYVHTSGRIVAVYVHAYVYVCGYSAEMLIASCHAHRLRHGAGT